MDIIFLNDLRVETVIGIFDWERSIRQTVSIDLQMGTDIRKASAADDINDTLDYKAVAKRLIEFVGGSEFGLVEALAENIARIVIHEFEVPWLRVQVNKRGALRGAKDVGVNIERGKRASVQSSQ